MRKLLSTFLLAFFGLPATAPLIALGQTTEGRLPACCRRAGDHHCAGNMAAQMEMATSRDDQPSPNPRFAPLTPRCPYAPATLPVQHITPGVAAKNEILQAHPEAEAYAATQVHITPRSGDDPSRPKRGPPTSIHT